MWGSISNSNEDKYAELMVKLEEELRNCKNNPHDRVQYAKSVEAIMTDIRNIGDVDPAKAVDKLQAKGIDFEKRKDLEQQYQTLVGSGSTRKQKWGCC